MRGVFHCRRVKSEDDGRVTFYMANGDGDRLAEITIVAPDEAFETFEEVPRAAHKYKATIKFELAE